VRVAPRDYTAALTRGGVPADFASLITYLFTELVEGRNAAVGDGVERALGRRPADFATTRAGAPLAACGRRACAGYIAPVRLKNVP
jgi:hypothetical protein